MTKTENYAQTKHKNVNENGGESVYNLTVAPFKCWLQNEQANNGSFLDLSIAEEVNVILLCYFKDLGSFKHVHLNTALLLPVD